MIEVVFGTLVRSMTQLVSCRGMMVSSISFFWLLSSRYSRRFKIALALRRTTEGAETYNINQDVERTFPSFDQLRCVMLSPSYLILLSEVPLKRFLSPGAIDRIRNRSEC